MNGRTTKRLKREFYQAMGQQPTRAILDYLQQGLSPMAAINQVAHQRGYRGTAQVTAAGKVVMTETEDQRSERQKWAALPKAERRRLIRDRRYMRMNRVKKPSEQGAVKEQGVVSNGTDQEEP